MGTGSGTASGREADGTDADCVVIGGGIVGTSIARDVARRGLRVTLVEQGDLAGGTSSASSRLIHGGLRYLEHGDLRLVFEALRERAILLRIAPHLVRPLPFVMPVHRGDRVGRWKLAVGMWLYDLLKGSGNLPRHRMLSKRALLRLEPALDGPALLGGARYYDAQCDDARLAIATARSAAAHGARILVRTRVDALCTSGGRVTGISATDRETGATTTLLARAVVNATGPWADTLRRLEDPAARPALRPTLGVHVVVPGHRLPIQSAVTITSRVDGRVMFALPWAGQVYIGTTDTDWSGDPATVAADEADIIYLLRSANACFPAARLGPEDVVATWAGLRPLVSDAGAGSTAAVSREHAILEGPGGMLSVVGGKLTTARSMAAEVGDAVARRVAAGRGARPAPRPPTDREPLPGGEAADVRGLAPQGIAAGLPEATVLHCLGHYGTEAAAIFRLVEADRSLAERLHPDHPAVAAEVLHAARREYARSVDDVLTRRLHLRYLTADRGAAAVERVVALLGDELGWDGERRLADATAYLQAVRTP